MDEVARKESTGTQRTDSQRRVISGRCQMFVGISLLLSLGQAM
jgi:hypothetical protein